MIAVVVMSPSGVAVSARSSYETFVVYRYTFDRTELRLNTPSSSRTPRIVAVS
jgi:hypothetical protein